MWECGEEGEPRPNAGHALACQVGRGHVKSHQYRRSASGFIANEIASHFEFHPGWWRRKNVRPLVREYYAQVRALLRDRADLRPYRKRCVHCGIVFFTGPSNACRTDLRCGFGCRQAHKRMSSNRRSAAFYCRNPDAKRRQNQKRYRHSACLSRPVTRVDKSELFPAIVRHVRLIVSLVERRWVAMDEIIALLAKKGRQRRIVRRRGVAYGGRRIDGRGT
jgi:hypothetical protein